MNREALKVQGFTLVEMLVAITIGAVVSAVILQLFANISRSYKIQAAINQLNENGQYAMEYLARDIRDLGFWGCVRDVSNITNNLNTVGTGYDADMDVFEIAITGVEDDANDTDSLTIRGANDIGQGATLTAAQASASAVLAIPPSSGVVMNDILLVSDCLKGDVFQVTSITAGGSVGHAALTTNPGNLSANLSKAYGTDASVYRPYTHIYTIEPSSDDISGLFRESNDGKEELVHGVEKLVIYYGIDTADKNTATRYVRFDGVTDPSKIVSVRIEMVLVSADANVAQKPQSYLFDGATITPTDHHVRRVYSRTIVLKNRVG